MSLRIARVVDLTRTLTGDVPMWPGQPAPVFRTPLTIERDGVYLQEIRFWEHSGTHLDAPAHFIPGGRTVEAIDASRLVLPAVVIDVRARCEGNPDYALGAEDVAEHEARHGRIPSGGAALVMTGWDAFRDDAERYVGSGEVPAFPGIGVDAARVLVEDRGVAGLGIDTIGIDPGAAVDCPVHREVSLPRDVWHLEGLVDLDQVPPTGAWISVGVLPWRNGSGSPARVLALLG